MTNTTFSTFHRLNCLESAQVLAQVEAGRGDGPLIKHLILLFKNQTEGKEIPLTTLLPVLWPDKSFSQSVAAFRPFKKRLNAHLALLNLRAAQSSGTKRPSRPRLHHEELKALVLLVQKAIIILAVTRKSPKQHQRRPSDCIV